MTDRTRRPQVPITLAPAWEEPRIGAPQAVAGCLFWVIVASPTVALIWWILS